MASEKEPRTHQQKWSLKGMSALVTGGTKGIGYAIVEELAEFGAKVYTCSRNQSELEQRLKEWEGKGYQVSGSTCDLSSRVQREELMKNVSSFFDGKLNILVNNAATTLIQKAENTSAEDYSDLMGLNIESPFHLSQLAYPLLKASQTGNLIFISSVAGLTALPGLSVYSATKGAINQLTKNLATEWAKDYIRVNTVAPWAVKTTIGHDKVMDESLVPSLSQLLPRTPLRPMAEADEISPLVAFLAFRQLRILQAKSYMLMEDILLDLSRN